MKIEDLNEEREFVRQANILYNQGKYEKAISAYDEALQIVPEDADVLFSKGDALVKLGKTPEAMKCFEEATQQYMSGLG